MGRSGRSQLAGVAVGLASIAWAAPADADSSADEMSRDMHTYFGGELELAAIACGLAAGSGYVGGVLLSHATDATRSAAVPVLVVGLAEAIIGIGLLVRTGPQVRKLDARIAGAPKSYIAEEGARMERVLANFVIFRTIETLLLVGGATTAALGGVFEEDRAIGAGLGVTAQATIALALDGTAEARAERYHEAIREFAVAPTIAPSESGTHYGLSFGGRF